MPQSPPELTHRLQTQINIDCIKFHPFLPQFLALSFYQQSPQFVGGVQILHIDNIHTHKLGHGEGYIEMGPIMHIEWLKKGIQINKNINIDINIDKNIDKSIDKSIDIKEESTKWQLIAAARCNQAILLSCTLQNTSKITTTTIQRRIKLSQNTFCLYCDLKLLPTGSILGIASTSQSTVYSFTLPLSLHIEQDPQIISFPNHQYAVWACSLSPAPTSSLMLTGDQVDTLYLYDISTQKLRQKNSKVHTQGICEINWIKDSEVYTGSFDGTFAHLLIYQEEGTMQIQMQVKRLWKVGGIIWRVIPLYEQQEKGKQQFLLCNSSENKFQIFWGNQQQGKVKWDSGDQHKSLAYSADHNQKYIVTASFYDKQVRVWKKK